MNTTTLDAHRAQQLTDAMGEFHQHPRRAPDSVHSVTVEPAVGMLVEPVNGDPYVFVLPNVLHTFVSIPHSGTDKLRQRMEAGIFFRGLVAQHEIAERRRRAEEQRTAAPERGRAMRVSA